MRTKKVEASMVLLTLILSASLLLGGCNIGKSEDMNIPEKFISTNFIELSQIEKISKFRSGYGHDFSYSSKEKCRSMKHYLDQKPGITAEQVKYYAPVDGKIKHLQFIPYEYGTEAQFSLIPSENSKYRLRFFHVDIADGIQDGTKVTQGQVLGTIGHPQAHAEIGVELTNLNGGLISFFELITDELAAEYAKYGVTTENIIISKEERNANPLQCDPNAPDSDFLGVESVQGNLEAFHKWQVSEENWVTLTE